MRTGLISIHTVTDMQYGHAVSQIYYADSEGTESKGQNGEIKVLQTSTIDDERTPAQKGAVRMKLSLSGWLLK